MFKIVKINEINEESKKNKGFEFRFNRIKDFRGLEENDFLSNLYKFPYFKAIEFLDKIVSVSKY